MVLFVDSTEESSYFGGNFARYHRLAVSFQHSGSPAGRYALKADKMKKGMSVFS